MATATIPAEHCQVRFKTAYRQYAAGPEYVLSFGTIDGLKRNPMASIECYGTRKDECERFLKSQK